MRTAVSSPVPAPLALVPLLAALLLPLGPAPLRAQGAAVSFTAPEADSGSKQFALHCVNCHPPGFHTSPVFRAKWTGRTLGELYGYLRREMPKQEPGGLTDEEYRVVLAYLLQLNGIAAGRTPLPADSTALSKYRFLPQ